MVKEVIHFFKDSEGSLILGLPVILVGSFILVQRIPWDS